MTTKTRTEYETAEKEVEYVVCDSCGVESDELPQLSLNPREEVKTDYDVILSSEDEEEVFEEYQRHQPFADPEVLWTADPSQMHTLRQATITRPVEADETFDVCLGCLEEVFGLDLPDDYETVSIDSPGLTVEAPEPDLLFTGRVGATVLGLVVAAAIVQVVFSVLSVVSSFTLPAPIAGFVFGAVIMTLVTGYLEIKRAENND